MRVGSGPKVVVGFYGEGGVGFGLLQHSDHTLSEDQWRWVGNFGVVIVGFALPYPSHPFVRGMLVK